MIKFKYLHRPSLFICIVLIGLMIRASFWQWERHLEKKNTIQNLNKRVIAKPISLDRLLNDTPDSLEHHKININGEYDFKYEIYLKNRRYKETPGVHILTPLKLKNDKYILVNRGFLPMGESPSNKNKLDSFTGLIKKSNPRKYKLAPKDPTPNKANFIKEWLRVDIKLINKQLPYELLPVYLEIMNTKDLDNIKEQIFNSNSGKSDILSLVLRSKTISLTDLSKKDFPIPAFDAVLPPGRHFGYVFEWGFMALGTFIILLLIQIRHVRRINKN